MTRWTIITSFAFIAIVGAVLLKTREVSGLREQARQLSASSVAVAQAGPSSMVTKPRGERPDESTDDESGEEEKIDPLENISLFQPNGELSTAAIGLLELSEVEARGVTESARKFRTQSTEDLSKRLKPTGQHSDDGAQHEFYYARARRDRGQALFDALTMELGSNVGQDRSRRLMKVFTRNEELARVCKMDLEVEVIQPEEEGGEVTVNHELRSPRDGSSSSGSSGGSLAGFEESFGKIFGEQDGSKE